MDLNDILTSKAIDILNGSDDLKLKYHLYDYMTLEAAYKKASEGHYFIIEDGHVTGFGRYFD